MDDDSNTIFIILLTVVVFSSIGLGFFLYKPLTGISISSIFNSSSPPKTSYNNNEQGRCLIASAKDRDVYNRITKIVNNETQRPVNAEQLEVWREMKHTELSTGCDSDPLDPNQVEDNTQYMRNLIERYRQLQEQYNHPNKHAVPLEQAQAYQHDQELSRTCPYDCPNRK